GGNNRCSAVLVVSSFRSHPVIPNYSRLPKKVSASTKNQALSALLLQKVQKKILATILTQIPSTTTFHHFSPLRVPFRIPFSRPASLKEAVEVSSFSSIRCRGPRLFLSRLLWGHFRQENNQSL